MADPLTALMYAVQVMNFLKTLIAKTLKAREGSMVQPAKNTHVEPSVENGLEGPSQPFPEETTKESEESEQATSEDPQGEYNSVTNQTDDISEADYLSYRTSTEGSVGTGCSGTPSRVSSVGYTAEAGLTNAARVQVEDTQESIIGQSSVSNYSKILEQVDGQQIVSQAMGPNDRSKGIGNFSKIDSRTEQIEARSEGRLLCQSTD